MSRIIGIDPGPYRSAWVILDTEEERVVEAAWEPNEALPLGLRSPWTGIDAAAIEAVTPRYGVDVGWDTIETIRVLTMLEISAIEAGVPVMLVPAPEALRNLDVVTSRRAGEPKLNVAKGRRDALVDRFGGPDIALGRKADPGPLYLCRGNEGHTWPAAALAVYAWDNPEATPYADALAKARAKRQR